MIVETKESQDLESASSRPRRADIYSSSLSPKAWELREQMLSVAIQKPAGFEIQEALVF